MILVAGAGGFIGGHLVGRLLDEGQQVRAVDIKPYGEWWQFHDGAQNTVEDLRKEAACDRVLGSVREVYNLACDMGGMGFIASHRAECMLSVLINTRMLQAALEHDVERYLFASSACVYPGYRQDSSSGSALRESDAYPADPEDGYGWEKLFSERLCCHFTEDFGLATRVVRYHNVYGPHGTWMGGREKAPAAICRKVAEAELSGNHEIEVWGDGEQTRSFMHIDDCVEGTRRIMDSDVEEPINLGSDQAVTINQLVDMAEKIAGLRLERRHVPGPQGVRGRCSENTMIRERVGWEPKIALEEGLEGTYRWIYEQATCHG